MNIPNTFYLIVDVEATCSSDKSIPPYEMEIIEIGAVMMEAKRLEVVSEFQTFIKPVRHPKLTAFCIELTTITQKDVEIAPRFSEAINSFKTWLSQYPDYLFCSWGNYDRKQFEQDCAFHKVLYPFASSHFDLKEAFSQYLGKTKKYGLGGALKHIGLEFEGTPHRGIDDVRNMARIVQKIASRPSESDILN
jgi:inhibitor of KinA sporulation pathway (predicted exonuclease)